MLPLLQRRFATNAGASPLKKNFILFYNYVPDILERRGPLREKHLSNIKAKHANGEIIQAGALIEPLDGAAIIFSVDKKENILDFVNEDPCTSLKISLYFFCWSY